MMKLIPYSKFRIETFLSPDEVANVIKQEVGPPESFLNFTGRCKYCGTINGRQFKIRKNIAHRNSFLPIIFGTVENSHNGSMVSIVMRPQILSLVFMMFWLLGVVVACILTFIFSEEIDLIQLTPFVMFVFGLSFPALLFWSEAPPQKTDLIEMIRGKEFTGSLRPPFS